MQIKTKTITDTSFLKEPLLTGTDGLVKVFSDEVKSVVDCQSCSFYFPGARESTWLFMNPDGEYYFDATLRENGRWKIFSFYNSFEIGVLFVPRWQNIVSSLKIEY